MTVAEMLTRTRTLLDEASASFWADSEIYSAFTDGQIEVIRLLLNIYKAKLQVNPRQPIPDSINALIKSSSGTLSLDQSTVSVPSDMIYLLNVQYNPAASTPLYPCFERGMGRLTFFDANNTYLKNDTTFKTYYYYFDGSNVKFEQIVTTGTAGYTLNYIKNPSAITSGVNPTIGVVYHDAIISFAFAQMLQKDQRIGEANSYFQKFFQQVLGQ